MGGRWLCCVVGLVVVAGGCAIEGEKKDGHLEPVAGAVSQAPASTPTNAPPTTAPTKPPAATPVVKPVTVRRLVVVTRAVAFKRVTKQDASLEVGTREVTKRGRAGVQRLTYEVTFTGGVQVGKRLVRQVVTRKPVAEVTSVGTKAVVVEEESGCDPNYSGACVPIASDVDCSSGSGNGPAYVVGPVQVIGRDIYGLDGNNDGVGCENG
ncbi:G5 domain-containing protein [Kribbella lupini]